MSPSEYNDEDTVKDVMESVARSNAVIYTALNEAMAACGSVSKDNENKFHHYKYASEASLLHELRPALVKAGIILIPSVRSVSPIDQYGNTIVEVQYTIAHKSGVSLDEKVIVFGCGNDKNKTGGVGDKGIYKAMTGANKYMLFKLFQIETNDDPEGTTSGDTATNEKPQQKSSVREKEKPSASTLAQPTDEEYHRSGVEPFKGQVTEKQVNLRLWKIMKDADMTKKNVYDLCIEMNGDPNPHALDWKSYKKVCDDILSWESKNKTVNENNPPPF